MTDYSIRVRIDPGDASSGSRVVKTELQGIRDEAEKTKAAVAGAADINPSGAAAGAGVVENSLEKISEAATRTGVAVERALSFNTAGAVTSISSVGSSFDLAATGADKLYLSLERVNATVSGNASLANTQVSALGRTDQAINKLTADTAKLKAQTEALGKVPPPMDKIGPSAKQAQQATLHAEQQFQDFAQQVTLGINPITAFTQQAGQMAYAMSNMGGTAGTVGRFLAGPWGTLVLVGASVLGQFIYKMIEAGEATDEARDSLDDYAKKQQDLANFVDFATGKIIAQTSAVKALALAQREAELSAQKKLATDSKQAAFDIARRQGVRYEQIDGQGPLVRIDRETILKATRDANGDVNKLIDNLNALGPAYKGVAKSVTEAAKDSITFQQAEKQLNADLEALHGNTKSLMATNAEYQLQQVRLANATTEREKAQIKLTIAERSYNNIAKGSGADSAQAKAQLQEVDRLTKQVNQAKEDEKSAKASARAATKAANQAERAGERYSEAIRRLKAEGDLVDLYGREYEIRKAQIGVENTLKRALSGGEAGQVKAIVESNLARKAEGDILRALFNPIEEYKTQVAALEKLLDKGRITQEQYNAEIAALPLQSALDDVESSLLGAADRYDVQLRKLDATIARAVQTIRDAQAAGLKSKEQADAEVAQLVGPEGKVNPDGSIEVTGGSGSAAARGQAKIELAQRQEANGLDQQIGGQIGQDAEFDAIKLRHDQQLAELADFYGAKYAQDERYIRRKEALDKRQANEERQFVLAKRQVAIQAAADTFDTLANLAESFGGKQSAVYKAMFAVSKAFAIADSIIKIQQGIANALSLPFPENIVAAGVVAAEAASIISNIQSVALAFRDGGLVGGAGGPRDDKVLARLSAGEFVVNAQATSRNRPILEAINDGREVTAPSSRGQQVAGGGVTVQVGDINVVVESSGDAQQDGALIGEAVRDAIRGVVREELVDQSRGGGILTRTRQSILTS